MKTPLPLALGCVLAVLSFTGCATRITTDVTQNPPPSEKLAAFGHIELVPIRLVAPYAGQEANEKALRKIQEIVTSRMEPVLAGWNSSQPADGRTLVIEPVIDEIKFINATSRFWGGAMAGSSAVILRATLKEKASGRIVAAPLFYARAAAMGGAYSFGGTDNAMLARIANRLSDYLIANYPAAVGGPTGAEQK